MKNKQMSDYVKELQEKDDEMERIASNLIIDPKDKKVFSKLHRDIFILRREQYDNPRVA